MATFTYSADQFYVVIDGNNISGFQDGSSIDLEMDEDVMTKQVDIDGVNVVFNKTNNHAATLTFTLNEGSANNDILSTLYLRFRNSASDGVVPVMLKDNNGRSVATSVGAIQTLPNMGGGRESSGREWVLGLGQTQFYIGGAEAV